MLNDWPEIPGVTSSSGRARLPRRPEVVVTTLALALTGKYDLPSLVTAARAETHADRIRLAGLAGWLPLSHVAWWDPSTGALGFEAGTNLSDLSIRYAAWCGAQPVTPADIEPLKAYTSAVVATAHRTSPALPAREGPPRSPNVTRQQEASGEPLVSPELTERLRIILEALDGAFLERQTHTRAALLALLSGNHALLLGPPGTAKSLLARALCSCFDDATYFEYLLSRFTHPDELFGPVSIPGLKVEDYRRLTEGFLPQSHVAFLDEIFKANSAILNSLLTLINERVFHHGRHRDRVPLIGMLGASNELPDPEGGLAALYDRFLVRLSVPPLASPDSFLAVATGELPEPSIPAAARITAADRAALHAAAQQVEVSDAIQRDLLELWTAAQRSHWAVSDRRWRQAIAMLKVGAAADGRRSLSSLDLLLLAPVLAPTPDDDAEVREAILQRLGTASVPQNDLRAQWTLLRADRVAPIGDYSLFPANTGGTTADRLARRSETAQRFLAHHEAAVRRLAGDRERLERMADSHLWIRTLPPDLLSAHIEASRDLAAILKVSDRYARAVASPNHAVCALIDSLPMSRRVYGSGAVVNLRIADATVSASFSIQGEQVQPAGVSERGSLTEQVPTVEMTAGSFIEWLGGDPPTRELLEQLAIWPRRDPGIALEAIKRLIGNDAVPRAPSLPQP